MSRIRVMHVLDRLGLAGTEYGVVKLVNHLDRPRFDSAICCLRRAYPHARGMLHADIPVFELERREGRDLGLVIRLARLFRRERVDVAHSHNWSTYAYSVTAAKLAGVPVVVHGEHGRETDGSDNRRLRRVIKHGLSSLVDQFIVVSPTLLEPTRHEWGLGPGRVLFIPNGVDLTRFGVDYAGAEIRRGLGIDPTDLVVGSIGRFHPVKDHDTLFRAFARVKRSVANAKLLLIGYDEGAAFRARFERDHDEWGLGLQDVRWLGVRKDTPELVSVLDVYVNSSLYEGMSNTILEAMASRKPVVATAVGGNPTLVEDGLNGWLVPPRDPERMAEKIMTLLRHPELAWAMGRAGRERVERWHRFDAMIQANAAVYESHCARAARRWGVKERIKYGIGWICHRSGALAAADTVGLSGLTIVMYHRVLPLPEKLRTACQGMITATDAFERQMATLAERYRVLTMEEALRYLRNGIPFPRRSVAVTFDDGYADTYVYARPILKRYRIPAMVFLATGYLDTAKWPWWDDLANSLSVLHRFQPPESRWDPSVYPPEIGAALVGVMRASEYSVTTVDRLVALLNLLDEGRRRTIVDDLRAHAEELGAPPRPRLMLTWDQVREMQRDGIAFGGHTINHVFLDSLSAQGAIGEIEGCLDRITSETGLRPYAFAYPKGRVDDRVRECVARCKVDLAVTTSPGINRPGADPLALKRRDAGYFVIGERFVESQMAFEMAGLADGVLPR